MIIADPFQLELSYSILTPLRELLGIPQNFELASFADL